MMIAGIGLIVGLCAVIAVQSVLLYRWRQIALDSLQTCQESLELSWRAIQSLVDVGHAVRNVREEIVHKRSTTDRDPYVDPWGLSNLRSTPKENQW